MSKAGTGKTGTVWLAVHVGLEEYRAIKCVPKAKVDYETFRREALILKELRHPGIPLVYDLEEDENYFYLIEEYLEGYSLYALVTSRGTLKEADAIRYGMQLCSLVEYMHSAYEIPILHLDLQPNNLIICGDTVRLIDFNHSALVNDANSWRKRYGTVGCAAPEQYHSDRTLDVRTDIYAIGAVLRFMLCGTLKQEERSCPSVSGNLDGIIRKCMEPDRERRFSSAEEVADALGRLQNSKAAISRNTKAVSSLRVILTGSRSGAGTTHLAFGLCRFLTRHHYRVLYEECCKSAAVRTLAASCRARPDDFGIYRIRGCEMKPWYGPAVTLPEPEGFSVMVKDFGAQWQEAARAFPESGGILLAAVTENSWENGRTRRMLEELKATDAGGERPLFLAVRHRKEKSSFRMLLSGSTAKRKGIQLFRCPEYPDPFEPDDGAESFFQALWNSVEEIGGCHR